MRIQLSPECRFFVLALVVVCSAGACGAGDDNTGETVVDETVVAERAVETDGEPAAVTTTTSAPVTGDAFYVPPDPLPAGEPGELIRSEPIAAPVYVRAWRILYHSRAADGSDIAVSGTVIAPAGEEPAESRPIEAIALGSMGIADQCSPSRTPEPMVSAQFVAAAAEAGRVLAITDYEGLGTPGVHPYGAGESAGQVVLDVARAAGQLTDAHAGSRVVLSGFSQGGHAVLFGAELAPAYAPELDVVGAIAVAPIVDLVALMHIASTTPVGLGAALMLVYGLSAAYPEADPELVLTAKGQAARATVDEQCVEQLSATFASTAPADLFAADPSEVDQWRAVLERNTPASGQIDIPLLVVKGDADEILPKPFTDDYVDRLCAAGDPVEYRVYPGADHVGVLTASAADVKAWIADRFGRVPFTTTC